MRVDQHVPAPRAPAPLAIQQPLHTLAAAHGSHSVTLELSLSKLLLVDLAEPAQHVCGARSILVRANGRSLGHDALEGPEPGLDAGDAPP